MNVFSKLVQSSINWETESIAFEDLVKSSLNWEDGSSVDGDVEHDIMPHVHYQAKNAKKGKIKSMRVFIGGKNGHQVGPFEESLRRVDPDLMEGVKVEYKNMDEINVLINRTFLMI